MERLIMNNIFWTTIIALIVLLFMAGCRPCPSPTKNKCESMATTVCDAEFEGWNERRHCWNVLAGECAKAEMEERGVNVEELIQ